MPFSQTTPEHTEEYWTRHFELFLKPIIEKCPGAKAFRSHPLRGDMVREIIRNLVMAPIVIADITDGNPNVYWELGVRHSFEHGTIIIAEEGTKRRFDISALGTLYYLSEDPKQEEFVEQLQKAIEDCVKNPKRPDSQVLETVTGRGSIYSIINREESIRRLDALYYEITLNINMVDALYSILSENLKGNKGRRFSPGRFAYDSLELLTTNRYLDQDESFYQRSTKNRDTIHMINNELNIWCNNIFNKDKYLFSLINMSLKEYFIKYREEIEGIREKLLSRK